MLASVEDGGGTAKLSASTVECGCVPHIMYRRVPAAANAKDSLNTRSYSLGCEHGAHGSLAVHLAPILSVLRPTGSRLKLKCLCAL
jgi:hypothetical protein